MRSCYEADNFGWDLGLLVLHEPQSEVGLPDEVTEFSVGGNGWIIDGQPAPVIRGERVMNPDDLAEPIIEDDQIYGPNQPTKILGLTSTFTLPGNIRFTARGEYQADTM